MQNNRYKYFGPLIFVAVLFAIFLLLPFLGVFEQNEAWRSPTEKALKHKLQKEAEGLQGLHLDLVDPEQAPEELRQLVKLGYHIFLNTPQYAGAYTGDRLSCTNCHFAGGNTTGGKNGGISLVGVAAIYPKFDHRAQAVIDLPTRINYCFERSMNGKPIPRNSQEMLAITTYLQWISKGVPVYDKVPWLDLQKLKSDHLPDPSSGKKVYEVHCAMCHGKDGAGNAEQQMPPVWGPKSFNDAAGMNNESTLASFIYENMPYPEANLTVEQALDVAAFLSHQPRPHFTR